MNSQTGAHTLLAESLYSDANLARNDFFPLRTMKDHHGPTEVTGNFAIDVNGAKMSPRVFKGDRVPGCPRKQQMTRASILDTLRKFGLHANCRLRSTCVVDVLPQINVGNTIPRGQNEKGISTEKYPAPAVIPNQFCFYRIQHSIVQGLGPQSI